ncbi:MAG: TetR/AcrR family transcriptional regulator [Phycisphaerales bacterium]
MPRTRSKPAPKVTRAEGKAAASTRILTSARKLFLKQGFDSVSMRQIASAARFTPGALYVHFKDKHELVLALMNQDFALFQQSMDATRAISDPVERLRELGRAYIRFALNHPHHYQLMFMTAPPQTAAQASDIEHKNPDKDGYACLRATVADCIAQHRFQPQYSNVEATTQMCWASAHGLVSLYIAHHKAPWVKFRDPLETAWQLLDVHLSGLTGGSWKPPQSPRKRGEKP